MSSSTRRLALAMGIVVGAIVVAHVAERYHPNTWIFRDGRFYVNVNEGIVDGLTLEDRYAHSWYDGRLGWNHELPPSFSNVALGRQGQYYSFRPWLLPVLSTPLYFAFGLLGVLLFNVLLFPIIAFCAFRVCREFTSDLPAAVGTVLFVFTAGTVHFQYDYSVDILLLAMLAVASAGAVERGGGWLVGVCFGAAVLLKPTTLLCAPVVALLMARRGDRATLGRAVLGAGAVLGVGGLMNWHMFGRPWWFGYNRVLAVSGGEPVVFDDIDAFDTPLREGLREMWQGPWAVRYRWTAFALFVPGALAMARARPSYFLVGGAVVAANVVTFARFHYSDDRFLIPAAFVLLPCLALTVDLCGRGVDGVARLARRARPSDVTRAATIAALLAVAVAYAAVPYRAPTLDARIADDAYVIGALALASGSLDVRAARPDIAPSGAGSLVSRSRFGHWLPRASPAAVALAAPFALGGKRGLMWLHLLAMALATFAAVRVVARAAPLPLVTAVAVCVALLPPVREHVVVGGPALLAAAAAMLALERALAKGWLAAGILAALAAWLADAPWLVGLAVVPLAALEGRREALRCLGGAALVLLAWCLGHLALIGRPFASPEDFVLIGLAEPVEVPRPGVLATLRGLVEHPSAARAIVPLAVLAPFGLWRVGRADGVAAWLLAASLASLLLPGVLVGRPFLCAFLVTLPLCALAALGGERLHQALRWLSVGRRGAVAGACVLLALGAIGLGQRAVAAARPFRIASVPAVMDARVTLGDIPCDFLAWEHWAWECAAYDREPLSHTGLNVWRPYLVGGQERRMFLISSGEGGRRPRTVQWPAVRAGSTLRLDVAVPDGHLGDALVVVELDGEEAGRFVVPPETNGVEERSIDTSRWAGRDVTLAIRVGANAQSTSRVGFDGAFE